MIIVRTIIILFIAFSMLVGDDKESENIAYDIVKVHGMRLKGRVTHLGSQKLSFRLFGCEGVNYIDYKDIDKIERWAEDIRKLGVEIFDYDHKQYEFTKIKD